MLDKRQGLQGRRQTSPRVLPDRECHVCRGAESGLLVGDPRRESGDDSGVLEPFDADVGVSAGYVRLLGQCTHGDATVCDQFGDDATVDRIESVRFGGHLSIPGSVVESVDGHIAARILMIGRLS